jgi:hypothetical protein
MLKYDMILTHQLAPTTPSDDAPKFDVLRSIFRYVFCSFSPKIGLGDTIIFCDQKLFHQIFHKRPNVMVSIFDVGQIVFGGVRIILSISGKVVAINTTAKRSVKNQEYEPSRTERKIRPNGTLTFHKSPMCATRTSASPSPACALATRS